MIELQLVGYTADLGHLVFCDAADGAVRFKVPVDADLLATVGEIAGLIDPDGAHAHERGADRRDPPEPAPVARSARSHEPVAPAVTVAAVNGAPRPGRGALAAVAVAVDAASATGNGGELAAVRSSQLTPREIQALLRSGKTPRAVAKLAGTEEGWVRRWLPPIEAERDRVLQAVQRARVTKARLGPSRDLLGDAVRKNLADKGLGAEHESVEWTVARRDGDDQWMITLSYRSRGRLQRAQWRFDPESGELDARNALATNVAWTRQRGRAQAAAAQPLGPWTLAPAKRAPAKKKAAPKKAAPKKAAPKKAAPKKAAPKKAAPKTPPAKKRATRP